MCSGAQPRTHTIRQGRRQRGTGTRCSLHRLFPVSASKPHFTHSPTGLHKTLNAWAERQPSTIRGESLIPTQPPLNTHTTKTAIQYHTPRIAQKTTVPFYFPMNFTMKLLTALQPSPHKFAVHSQFCPFHGHFLPLDPSHTPWDLTWPRHRWLLRFPTLHAIHWYPIRQPAALRSRHQFTLQRLPRRDDDVATLRMVVGREAQRPWQRVQEAWIYQTVRHGTVFERSH